MADDEVGYPDDVFRDEADRRMYHKIDRTITLLDTLLDNLSVLKDQISRIESRVEKLEKGFE